MIPIQIIMILVLSQQLVALQARTVDEEISITLVEGKADNYDYTCEID
jgi:hypothetical protein